MRARKFRLAVEMIRALGGGMGPDVPQQGPHPVSVMRAPWAANRSRVPSSSRAARTRGEGGVTTTVTPGAMPPPASSTRRASLKSWARPPVQVPRKTQSMGVPTTSATGTPLAGWWGRATRGTMAEQSNRISPTEAGVGVGGGARGPVPRKDTPTFAPISADMLERTMRSSTGKGVGHRAHELHRPVGGPVGAHRPHHLQGHVLGADTGRQAHRPGPPAWSPEPGATPSR